MHGCWLNSKVILRAFNCWWKVAHLLHHLCADGAQLCSNGCRGVGRRVDQQRAQALNYTPLHLQFPPC